MFKKFIKQKKADETTRNRLIRLLKLAEPAAIHDKHAIKSVFDRLQMLSLIESRHVNGRIWDNALDARREDWGYQFYGLSAHGAIFLEELQQKEREDKWRHKWLVKPARYIFTAFAAAYFGANAPERVNWIFLKLHHQASAEQIKEPLRPVKPVGGLEAVGGNEENGGGQN